MVCCWGGEHSTLLTFVLAAAKIKTFMSYCALDLCPQSQITRQPTDNNGDNNNKEGEEKEEEEEEMGASNEGAADAMTTTTFD